MDEKERPKSDVSRTKKLVFTVTLYNIPEDMAVGVALTPTMDYKAHLTIAAAHALSLGIAKQNFREGAIVSIPLKAVGNSRGHVLAYLLAFAVGAMMHVVLDVLLG